MARLLEQFNGGGDGVTITTANSSYGYVASQTNFQYENSAARFGKQCGQITFNNNYSAALHQFSSTDRATQAFFVRRTNTGSLSTDFSRFSNGAKCQMHATSNNFVGITAGAYNPLVAYSLTINTWYWIVGWTIKGTSSSNGTVAWFVHDANGKRLAGQENAACDAGTSNLNECRIGVINTGNRGWVLQIDHHEAFPGVAAMPEFPQVVRAGVGV